MVTRIHEANDLNTDSVWQNGPLFLTGPISNWPISKEFTQQELPDKVGVTLASTITATSEMHVIDSLLDRVNDFKKLISVIAMLQGIFKGKSFKSCRFITYKDKVDAEMKIVKRVQLDIPDWKKRYNRLGPKLNEEGLIVVGSRMANWLKNNWNSDLFLLLPPKSRFTFLYAKHIHEQDHLDADTTVAKIRTKYWIRRCSPLVRSIKQKCIPY